jgi:GT2 family glycosyltransferase
VVHARTAQEDGWFDFLTAASVLLRREALETCGLFDEEFFMYWEDADLSYRLRRGGWRLGVAAASLVPHREHGSTRNLGVLDRYSVASGIRFLLKHSPAPWISIPMLLTVKVGRRIARGRLSRVADVVRGVRDYRERSRQRGHGAARPVPPAAAPPEGAA